MGKPKKRGREVSGSEEESLQVADKKSDKMKQIFMKINSDMKNNKEIQHQDATQGIFLALFGDESIYNIKKLIKKVENLEDAIEAQKESISANKNNIEALQKRLLAMEVERSERSVLIRNVPMKNKEGKEDFKETLILADSILDQAGLDRASIDDIFRLYPQNMADLKGKAPTLIIKFTSNLAKVRLFQNIEKIRKVYKGITILNDCPPSLSADMKKASQVAYDIRQGNSNVRTRCKITKTGIKLLVKEENGTKFKEKKFKD